jgi:hypothetical protein
MLLLTAAAIAAASQPQVFIFPQAVQVPVSKAKCKMAQAFVAGSPGRYDGKRPMAQKLTELPPADMYLAVLRHDENGCGAPIIVKYNLGR